MRLRRIRNAETAFPTLPAGGFLLDLRADAIRPYLLAADRTVGRAYMRAAAAVRCETTPSPQPLCRLRRHLPLHRGGEARRQPTIRRRNATLTGSNLMPPAAHRRGDYQSPAGGPTI